MSRTTYISTGSTTQVKTAPGSLYGVHVGAPVAGGQVVIVDALTTTASDGTSTSITSNFNQDPIGLVVRLGPYAANPQPDYIPFWGTRFDNGLVISVTSSTRITAFTD